MSLSHDSRKRVRVFFHVGQLKKPWVYSVLLLSTQEAARAHTKKSDLARGRERHFRTGKRADSLDTTLFRLPVLALPFSPTSSGRHYAGFPVAWDLCKFSAYKWDNAVWNYFRTNFRDNLVPSFGLFGVFWENILLQLCWILERKQNRWQALDPRF